MFVETFIGTTQHGRKKSVPKETRMDEFEILAEIVKWE